MNKNSLQYIVMKVTKENKNKLNYIEIIIKDIK